MLKLIGLSTALSLAAIVGTLPQAVFSRPKPQASNYPVRRNVEVASPFCYMRTPRGTTLNLEGLCRGDDGSANSNRAANVTNSPAPTTTPNQTAANGTSRNGPTVITITTPAGTVTPGGTNTNANGASNATNTNANGNLRGTNVNANGTSNGTNTSTNSNIGGANTGTSSNFGGTNSSANGTSNGINTGTSSNFGGTNRNILQP
jgi:hypothetical protein